MSLSQIEIKAPLTSQQAKILTPEALNFLRQLELTHRKTRRHLLEHRKRRQQQFDQGHKPDFLTETAHIRNSDWKIAPQPKDLLDRRVEITGPVDRKMIINALNSGAKVFMADFEDSSSPTWFNTIEGQINLFDAVRKTINLHDEEKNKHYQLNDNIATLVIRPRGWHLEEAHLILDGTPLSASLVDFGLYFYHNAEYLLTKGSGPYYYLPKLESHLEARLWNDVFIQAQDLLSIPQGSIKATVLIETITAAFEMDEILYELKQHSSGLNCGRWDYIFSFIKKFRNHEDCLLPDRGQVTMTRHFLKSYVDLLIKTCHRRGAHAMGGMAAQIPIKNDTKANEEAIAKVYEDKLREVHAGHDGTWVAHPGLIPTALQAFDSVMKGDNQLNKLKLEVNINQQDLLKVPSGEVTVLGIQNNINVGVQYLYSWLKGNGCVPINHLMEDAATAEICRSQLWQWLKFKANLSDGRQFTHELFTQFFDNECNKLRATFTESEQLNNAISIFKTMIISDDFDEFLTLPAYDYIKDIL